MSSSSSNSRSSIKGSRRLDPKFEYVNCRCGISAPCWEAWRIGTLDPGRRFFGCSRYKDPNLSCNFFQWAEPPYTDRAREVIDELKRKLDVKSGEIQRVNEEFSFAEKKVILLNEELMISKKKNKEYEVLIVKMEKTIHWLKKLFVVVVLVMLVVFVLIM
ncbi:GRF-type domain-containing protein [Heracleum sosnowskyi]|uniref:GRF-type domain-containing protein n=1 Tax=Heracleum sosnowskyi TaxID=360622 RepID=A0AAD8HVZ5_9APIA|nr:GRF-type domain-containing protein [Heracleum sosnowskyi]